MIKVPKNHTIWLTFTNAKNEKYIVTSDKTREWYHLHKVLKDNTTKRISRRKVPDFEELSP